MSSDGGSFGHLGVHVGADWRVSCSTYPARTPILRHRRRADVRGVCIRADGADEPGGELRRVPWPPRRSASRPRSSDIHTEQQQAEGTGGVIADRCGAGRLELVPPAAPGFSPVACKEEVVQLMRKVVTGEQVAQLTNPDPFAVPVLRAPVYRTPGWIIAVVQLGRLLWWLARLIVRHPVTDAVLAVLVLVWLNAGWPGLVALVLVVVAVLGVWRWAWPVLVRPLGRHPCPWQAAVLVLPAPLGRGDDHRRPGVLLPGPPAAAGARQGGRDPVHRPGGGAAGVRPVRRPTSRTVRTTWRTGSVRCCAGSAPPGPGAVVLEFVRRDALAAIVPALPVPAQPDLRALPVGRREDGLAWLVRLHGTHLLIAGATGAGKASLLWGLIRAMFPLMQAGLVRVLAADPKLMELAFGRVIFERYGEYAADPEAIADMLERAVADMQERAARFAGNRRDHDADRGGPVRGGAGR